MEILHEEWRPVVGREGQNEVSSLGSVRSLDRIVEYKSVLGGTFQKAMKGRVLKEGKHNAGYRTVSMDGRRGLTIHSIVAAAFIGPRPAGCDINHIDGDKTNNCAANLEYCTRKENMEHARRTGLWENAGENNGRATATNEQVLHAYELAKSGMSRKDAAAKTGIAEHVVQAAVTGRHWGLPPLPKRKSVRWTDEQIARCIELRRSGLTTTRISELTGVPDETVRRHCNKALKGV